MSENNQAKPQLSRLHVGARLSEAAIFNGVVYLAGQVPDDASLALDIEGQMQNVLQQIDSLLAQAGSDKSRVLMCQIYLPDLADYDGMNRAWDAWVSPGNAPPRATVQAKLANPAWRVEVVLSAAQY
ncbi:RidA family protein [Massilia sp. W12]|uniref:RidA family protein n=1 Tax=Massilia sp. W12 TaxID=3126507 RepID=UPI0030CC7CAB